MSIQNNIKNTFLPAEAEQIIKIYDELYYDDLKKEYDAFHFSGELSAEFFSSIRNNITISYITRLDNPQEDYVSTMLVLRYLQRKSQDRTERDFFQCLQKHDMKTLQRILKYNDSDGRYNKLVKEYYNQ